eukprot:8036810-Lingulodinium_polyedra.AAC.2
MPASKPPWCLVQGSIEDNLEALRSAPEPTEPTTWKIQQLLLRGENKVSWALGVRLMGDCSWSTTVTEQQHASVKLLQRHHPDWQLNSMLVRAGLHFLRRQLPGM